MCVGVKEAKTQALQTKCVQNVFCECCLPSQKEKEKGVLHGKRNFQIEETGMFVENFEKDFKEILRSCFLGVA